MRTDAFKRDIDVSEALPTAAFTIQANAKMFGILADRLYSDKPRAVIREIGCNALDAHSMNGQTKPFVISLPNSIEPMLTVRDFGPGMTHHEIMHNYTSFGSSTKDQSDAAVGGFGLGCKSPFAYADAFTVTAFDGTEKRNYAAYRGGDGIPQMAFVGSEPCDELQGIEVRVPVKDIDFRVFRETAADLLQYFPEGSFEVHGIEVKTVEYQSVEDGYAVRRNAPYRPVILMGPVAYPLDWSLILQEDDARLPETVTMVFDIGALDLLPSREGLSYDKQTIARLRDRYKLICEKFAEAQYELIKPMNRFEQLKFIAELKSKTGVWKMIEKRWPATYADPVPPSTIKTELTPAGFPGIVDFITLKGRPQMNTVGLKSSRRSCTTLELTNRRMSDDKATTTKFYQKNLMANTVFVFDDLTELSEHKRRVPARFKELVREWGNDDVDFILFDKSEIVKPGYLDKANDQWVMPVMGITGGWQSVDELRSALAEWDYVDTNVMALSEMDLPEPKAKAASTRSSQKTELRVLVSSKYGHARAYGRNCWNQTDTTYTSGVYIPLINYDTDDFNLTKWMKHPFLPDDLTILGLSKKARAQIKRDGNQADFERLDHYCERRLKEAMTDPAVKNELARRNTAALVRKDEIAKEVRLILAGRPGLFPKIDEALVVLQECQDQDVINQAERLLTYYDKEGLPKPKAVLKTSLIRVANKAYQTSPMLRLAVAAMQNHRVNILGLSGVDALLKVRANCPTTDIHP